MKNITEKQLKESLITFVATNAKRIEKDSYWNDTDEAIRGMDLSYLEFPNYSEEEMIALSGRKWKERFKLLIPFVTHFQYLTSNANTTALMLNQNGWLKWTYGSQMNGCNVLKYAIAIGLIAPAVQKKRFNCRHSYGYIYGWNKEAQKKVKSIIKKNSLIWESKEDIMHISLLKTFGKSYSDLGMTKLEFNRLVDSVRIGTDLKINATDEQIFAALSVKYPLLKELIEEVAEENKFLPSDERMKAIPTIHRSEKHHLVTKIGFRITNPYVSLKEHENEKTYNGKWRKEYMDEKFGKGNWEYFDVKSSVPRVTYLLNRGEWLDNEIDLYALMFNEGKSFKHNFERECCKKAFMRFYFDRSSSRISNRIRRFHLADEFIEEFGYSEGLVPTVEAIKTDIWKAIGESYNSEIFLYESYLYFKVFQQLRREGFHPKQIYDAFYFEKKEDKEDLKKKLPLLFKKEAKQMTMHISLLKTFGKPFKSTKKLTKKERTNNEKQRKADRNYVSNVQSDRKIVRIDQRTPDRPMLGALPSALVSNNRPVVHAGTTLRIGGTVRLGNEKPVQDTGRDADRRIEEIGKEIDRYSKTKEILRSFIFGKITKEDAERLYSKAL